MHSSKGIMVVMLVGAVVFMGSAGSAELAAAPRHNKELERQYMQVSQARTRAELAVRAARAIYGKLSKQWRAVSLKADQAHSEIADALGKAIEDERTRAPEMRNEALVDELNQRRRTVEQDWQRFSSVDRAAMEASYRDANADAQGLSTLFSSLIQLEPSWKDSKVDLPTLQATYTAVADRADAITQQAEDAFADLERGAAMWQKAAVAATQPSQPTSQPAKK